jgi:hypothetical protein
VDSHCTRPRVLTNAPETERAEASQFPNPEEEILKEFGPIK